LLSASALPQSHFHDCEDWEKDLLARGIEAGCKIFTHEMAQTASTVSLSILVTIEMLNAFNRSVRAIACTTVCMVSPSLMARPS